MAINILLVDDSKTTRSVEKKVLKLTGLKIGEIFEAANGQEALEKMRENWVDLILADLNMPHMNGVAMIDRMSADPLLAQIPVLVVSSQGNQTTINMLVEKGVKDFVRKPFDPTVLRHLIEKTLQKEDQRLEADMAQKGG